MKLPGRTLMALVFLLHAALATTSAQRPAPAAPVWNGSVRCEIDLNGPGYSNHQTHTWTLTGGLAPDGNPLDYPGTWTVTGAGSQQPAATPGSSASWKFDESAPGVRMAIFVRQSDQRLLVFLRNGVLSAPNGILSVSASEWRPFPTIEDVPTSTHISGSSTTPIASRLDATQPPGTTGKAACTWDLAQGGVPPAPRLSRASAPTAPTTPASAPPATAALNVVPLVQPIQLARLPLAVSPNSTPQNRPTVTVTLTGQNTHFVQGTTKADFHFSASATPVAVTVTSPTTATAQVTLPSGTLTGRYTVTLATGVEIAEAADAFMVTPAPDSIANVCWAAQIMASLTPGSVQQITGAIEALGVEDWLTINFTQSSSVHLTLRNASPDGSGSEFQMQAYNGCANPLGTPTTGTGAKTLDLPATGPHSVTIRISASSWDVARPIYRLQAEAR